ncbi:DNA polymerase III subunit delta [Lachnospiraceae bacterium MD1]|uniref:DNA polymerase III subunit delta n=1 Tax=Variimorphobacter saccharofermentans TaxID=2755051 RepID=A0A839K1N3_9FIRM|nr:DNA polymerase III subunit delta [Variimorphobacter saccharofermentans]MBB2183112.1 DNA polymerase III subunit delta [Variimorphobacter saccharofermentans]
MKVIKEHIRTGSFKSYYLLYGSEDYLKKLYRDKLKNAILKDDSDMNFSYFEGRDVDPDKVSQIAQTLPFFSDYRLIIIENSGLFKAQSELSGLIADIPASTIILFVESEIDKRNKLYKFVKDHGTVSEMNGLDEKNLKLFVISLLDAEGKRISESTVLYLLDKTGTDMVNIANEVQKLISYTLNKDIILPEDIDAVITTQVSGKIFQMIDAIGNQQPDKALELYYDLLSVREKPMSILYLIIRHFNILLQAKELQTLGFPSSNMSEKLGVPPFAVSKYLGQSRNFTIKQLKNALEFGTDIEEQIKTGRMLEKIGVELFILTFSKKQGR